MAAKHLQKFKWASILLTTLLILISQVGAQEIVITIEGNEGAKIERSTPTSSNTRVAEGAITQKGSCDAIAQDRAIPFSLLNILMANKSNQIIKKFNYQTERLEVVFPPYIGACLDPAVKTLTDGNNISLVVENKNKTVAETLQCLVREKVLEKVEKKDDAAKNGNKVVYNFSRVDPAKLVPGTAVSFNMRASGGQTALKRDAEIYLDYFSPATASFAAIKTMQVENYGGCGRTEWMEDERVVFRSPELQELEDYKNTCEEGNLEKIFKSTIKLEIAGNAGELDALSRRAKEMLSGALAFHLTNPKGEIAQLRHKLEEESRKLIQAESDSKKIKQLVRGYEKIVDELDEYLVKYAFKKMEDLVSRLDEADDDEKLEIEKELDTWRDAIKDINYKEVQKTALSLTKKGFADKANKFAEFALKIKYYPKLNEGRKAPDAEALNSKIRKELKVFESEGAFADDAFITSEGDESAIEAHERNLVQLQNERVKKIALCEKKLSGCEQKTYLSVFHTTTCSSNGRSSASELNQCRKKVDKISKRILKEVKKIGKLDDIYGRYLERKEEEEGYEDEDDDYFSLADIDLDLDSGISDRSDRYSSQRYNYAAGSDPRSQPGGGMGNNSLMMPPTNPFDSQYQQGWPWAANAGYRSTAGSSLNNPFSYEYGAMDPYAGYRYPSSQMGPPNPYAGYSYPQSATTPIWSSPQYYGR